MKFLNHWPLQWARFKAKLTFAKLKIPFFLGLGPNLFMARRGDQFAFSIKGMGWTEFPILVTLSTLRKPTRKVRWGKRRMEGFYFYPFSFFCCWLQSTYGVIRFKKPLRKYNGHNRLWWWSTQMEGMVLGVRDEVRSKRNSCMYRGEFDKWYEFLSQFLCLVSKCKPDAQRAKMTKINFGFEALFLFSTDKMFP